MALFGDRAKIGKGIVRKRTRMQDAYDEVAGGCSVSVTQPHGQNSTANC